MGANGKVDITILQITVDGREYCAMKGQSFQAEQLDIRLIQFSERLCEAGRDGSEKICYDIAEMTFSKSNQIWISGGIMISTALLGGVAAKLIESSIAALRRRWPSPSGDSN